jgi:hypothetical protein
LRDRDRGRGQARLADEYDAAQERGEVAKQGQRIDLIPEGNQVPTPADIGLTAKQVHEARQVRDAERLAPGLRLLYAYRQAGVRWR